jgi:hypothetical protein
MNSVTLSNLKNLPPTGPCGSVPGSSVTYTDDVWSAVDRSGVPCVFRGVRPAADGNICVHLVADPADTFVVIAVVAGSDNPMVFDKIKGTGTTITMSTAMLWI